VPDWLFEFVNPWTTPAVIVSVAVALAYMCRLRGRTLALVALSAAAGVGLWQAWKAGPPNGLLDLQIYTNSARAWINGGSLYDYADPVFGLSATYPPIGPLLFSALTPFTADGREVIFTCISLIALFGCAWSVTGLARVNDDQRLTWAAWAFAAATVSMPVWLSLRQGQINCIIWFLVLADLEALRKKRRWAGVGVGIATALKLVPGLFIAWFALTRRWSTTVKAIGAFLLATGAGWMLAASDSSLYWSQLLWDSQRVGSVSDGRNNSVLGLLARLSDDGTLRSILWVACCLAILFVAGVRSVRASRADDYLAVAAIVGCATAALSPISWTHHLGFLLVALFAFALGARTKFHKVMCIVGWLFLIDPGGQGDSPAMSTLRTLLVLGAVCFTPIRERHAKALTTDNKREADHTETTLSTRSTNSALPSSSLFRRIAIPPITFAPRS